MIIMLMCESPAYQLISSDGLPDLTAVFTCRFCLLLSGIRFLSCSDRDAVIASPLDRSGAFSTILLPFDLTRGGGLFPFHGHADIKLLSLYLQDAITRGNWTINLGLRGDIYHGLSSHSEAQPRLGIAYNIKKTNTVLRASYARLMETPFNENLVLSSTGCADPVLNPLLFCVSDTATPFSPGWRNEFHVGVQQAFGRYLVFSGEYVWKYTHHSYDFGVFGSTPLTFPIEWHNSNPIIQAGARPQGQRHARIKLEASAPSDFAGIRGTRRSNRFRIR